MEVLVPVGREKEIILSHDDSWSSGCPRAEHVTQRIAEVLGNAASAIHRLATAEVLRVAIDLQVMTNTSLLDHIRNRSYSPILNYVDVLRRHASHPQEGFQRAVQRGSAVVGDYHDRETTTGCDELPHGPMGDGGKLGIANCPIATEVILAGVRQALPGTRLFTVLSKANFRLVRRYIVSIFS